MAERNEYDLHVERLLPCTCNNRYGIGGHFSSCGGYWREEVAAALRESGKREAELQRELNRISAELGLPPGIGPAPGWLKEQLANYKMAAAERDDLRREAERLTQIIFRMNTAADQAQTEIAALKAKMSEAEKSHE